MKGWVIAHNQVSGLRKKLPQSLQFRLMSSLGRRVDGGLLHLSAVKVRAMNQDQIFYMQEVLGISSVLVPVGEGALATDAILQVQSAPVIAARVRGTLAHARLVAVWERAVGPGSGEAEILVEKMVTAMKVQSTHVLWIDWDPSEGAVLPPEIFALLTESAALPSTSGQARPILVFGEHTARTILPSLSSLPLGRWLVENENRYMVTLSPEELLESTEKKRIAWAHLQTVMKEL